jgi:DNA-binding SARP family transcriptional activator
MFVFRKKNQDSKQIDPLLRILGKDPENTKVRLRLADLYLRVGDKASAISEYQKAAEYLMREGFHFDLQEDSYARWHVVGRLQIHGLPLPQGGSPR